MMRLFVGAVAMTMAASVSAQPIKRVGPDASPISASVEVPAGSLKPGLYTCQVSIIDVAASRFTFPRLEMYVR